MTEKTFSELYCIQQNIRLEEFEAILLKRALYPHARLVAPLAKMLWPEYFAADLDFVRSVGRLRRFRDFFHESEEFAHHPANTGALRLTLNIRVSSRSIRRMVKETLHSEMSDGMGDESVSAVPFRGKKPE
jgi:hypothetical protein